MRFSLFTAVMLAGATEVARARSCTGPLAQLSYATYEGTALENGVNQFLGMRYAESPVGENRFRKPKSPRIETGLQQAKEHGPVCVGVTGLAFPAPDLESSEDCLFIDVYAPATISEEAEEAGGLPVMIWLQGGAFVLNFNPNYNGSGLIEASGGNVIVVSFNYRVGPYGFLASEELQEEGNLNVGLHDQRAAMRWVEQNIGAFGGDPDKVTLFGASVGGGTVLLHGLAYGGQPPETDNPPWRAGIAGSVYMPSIFELGDLEFQFQDLLEATGCTDLACLRSLDSERIQEANQARPFPDQTSTPLFPYTAVIDNELFTGNAHDMLAAGNFSTDRPFIIGTSSSEGTLFVPQANTTEDVNTFLRLQFEGLTDEDLVEAHGLYEDVPQTYPGVTATLSPLFFRAAKMYGDASFFCPAVDFSETLGAAGVTAHAFRNNILDDAEVAAGYLVPHTWEVPAVWGPEFAVIFTALPTATSYLPGGANHGMVDVVQSYWLSFVATGDDPNADRAQGSPMWETFGDAGFLRLQSNNTAMEQFAERDAERCEFWRRLSAKTHI